MLRTYSIRLPLQGAVAALLVFAASPAYAQTTSKADDGIGASQTLALSSTASFAGPGNAARERGDGVVLL